MEVPLPLGSRTVPMPQLPASNSNSSQRLNRSRPLTHSLINQPARFTPLLLIVLLIPYLGTDRTENTVPLLLFAIVAVQTCLFPKPLLSDGSYIFAYLAVVAQQRVYKCSSISTLRSRGLIFMYYLYMFMLSCKYSPR
jgi:hypothetical protein